MQANSAPLPFHRFISAPKSVRAAAAISLFATFFLSDYYRAGVGRPFDYAAVLAMILFLATARNVAVNAIGASLCFALLLLPWFTASIFDGNVLAPLAWLSGILVIFPASATLARNHPFLADRALYFALLAALVFFSVQATAYYVAGVYIDFQELSGSIQSRGLNEELGYFRPAGAFQEPNAYCTVVFCIISARRLGLGRQDWTHAAGLISMVLSQSLWGAVGAVLLMFVIYELKTAVMIFLGLLVAGAALAQFFGDQLTQLTESSITLQRILEIDSDPSREGRIGDLDSYLSYSGLFLGKSFALDQFQQLGANAYAFLIYSFGLAGCLGLAIVSALSLEITWRKLLVGGLLFVTFPQFSYMFFWSWLAITFARRTAR